MARPTVRRARVTGLAPRTGPVALAALFLALLVWYLAYTNQVVRSLQEDAQTFTRIYQEIQNGLTGTEQGAELAALTSLQLLIREKGVPLIVTDPDGRVTIHDNLPFEAASPPTAEEEERILRYVEGLDLRNDPVGDPSVQLIHYGMTPEAARLRWIPWLQASGLLLTVLLGITVFRYQRRAVAEQAWTAMARELAHQLGTPISSLQGWAEVLGLPAGDRPQGMGNAEIASNIDEDLIRLERVSRRFELIGREPHLKSVSLAVVVEELRGYMEARLPRFGSGVKLSVDVPSDLPNVLGHEVLLAWALENVIKNALDAVAGQGGTITLSARPSEGRWVVLRIKDTGPGVAPDVRDRIFDPGISTKSGGWGVGLTLTRRIIEVVHGGEIELLDRWERGATFQVRLPRADNT